MRAKRWQLLLLPAALLLAANKSAAQIDALTGQNGSKAESQKVQATANEKKGIITKVESKPIPFKTTYELSRTVGQGRLVKVTSGKPGETRTIFEVKCVDGKVVSKVKVGTEKVAPINEHYLVGKTGYVASRGHYERGRVLTMQASAYDPSAGRGSRATFRTATGERAKYGVVAVDPRFIPLGTMVFVEGYGFARASDTGGAIKGNRIDLCMNTNAECIKFGRRTVRVHILK